MLSGAFLLTVSGLSLHWAMGTAPDRPDDSSGAQVQAAPVALEVRTSPADTVVTGSATAIAAAMKIGDPSVTSSKPPNVCDTAMSGWIKSDSTRVSGAGSGVTISVTAWRAGAASSGFAALEKAASACFDSYSPDGQDELRATRSADGALRGLAAVRLGDVLAVAWISSLKDDPTVIANQFIASATTVLTPRLRGVCVDPTSKTRTQNPKRDPFAVDYAGLKVPLGIRVADALTLSQSQISAITSVDVTGTWRAPNPRPVPSLAPLAPPPPTPTPKPSPSTSGTPSPSPTTPSPTPTASPSHLNAPNLVDPGSLSPPNGTEPDSPVGVQPPTPTPGPQVAEALVPAIDASGPGCGWAFTSTVAPTVTAESVAAGTRDAVVSTLVATTADQSRALVSTLAWPDRYAAWARRKEVENNWTRYRQALVDAQDALASAKAQYQDSLKPWSSLTRTGTP
ncbi:MAG: hypothetical protein WCP28_07915 [Actinomycetes bacterium]